MTIANNLVSQRLRDFLNGRMTVTLVAIELQLDSRYDETIKPRDDIRLPFMPYLAQEASADTISGDIGRGIANCFSARVFSSAGGPCIRFGRSAGTALEAFYRDTGEITAYTDEKIQKAVFDDSSDFYAGNVSSCFSLWRTPTDDIAILAIEELEESPRSVPATVRHHPDGLIDLISRVSGIGRDNVTLSSLGLTSSKAKKSNVPLRKLIVDSAETIRGCSLARSLTVIAEAGMQDVLDQFVGSSEHKDFEIEDVRQQVGYVPTGFYVDLVSEPSVQGARSAMSDDGRMVLLNIDSMSVRHDYMGVNSERLISALMPLIADVAAAEKALKSLRSATSADNSKSATVSSQLYELNRVRREQVDRRARRAFSRGEQFQAWSNSGHLASLLSNPYDSLLSSIDEQATACADAVESSLNILRQRRESRSAMLVAAFTVMGAFFAALTVFATLVSVPPDTGWGWLSSYAVPLACVPIAILGAALTVQWLRYK